MAIKGRDKYRVRSFESTDRATPGSVVSHLQIAFTTSQGTTTSDDVRVQVLTNARTHDRDKQITVVRNLTDLAMDASAGKIAADRAWVPLTVALAGGWGQIGHAHTNKEIVVAARDEIAPLQSGN